VLPGGLDQPGLLADVVAEGLFDVDVLPRLDGPDRGQAVPVVGHRDRDDVDRLVLEDLPQVLHVRGLLAGFGLGDPHGLADDPRVGIADDGHFRVRHGGPLRDVDAALAMDAEHGDAQALVGRARTEGLGGGGGPGDGHAG
jgi:hypothetical protein